MSVEIHSAAPAPTVKSSESPARTQQGHAGEAKNKAGQSPFLALLAALDPQALLPAQTGEGLISVASDGVTPQDVPMEDPASLLVLALGAAGTEVAPVADLQGTVHKAHVAVAPAATGATLETSAVRGAESGEARGKSPALGSAADPRRSRQIAAQAATRAAVAQQGTEARASDARGAHQFTSSADAPGAQWKAAFVSQVASGTAATGSGPAFQDVGGWLKGAAVPRSNERSVARPGVAAHGAVVIGGGVEAATNSNGAAAAPTPVFTLESTGTTASATLADKLNYWVSRGVQNAELQLDAFGGGTVDVSIAVNGRDAQVEFRTDVPEARRMLQEALPQLKEMLQGEGLVLSGGFVGTSAQGDPGAQERKGPAPGMRSGLVRMEALDAQPLTGRSGGAGRATGRTVDLFV